MGPWISVAVAIAAVAGPLACTASHLDGCAYQGTCAMGAYGATKSDAGKDASSGGARAQGGTAGTGGTTGASGAGASGGVSGGPSLEAGPDAPAPCGGPCALPTPICDATTNTCVGCVGNSDCTSATTPICDSTGTKTCVQCLGNSDCSGDAGTAVCDPGTNTCVECTANTDCNDPKAARCDATLHACKPCAGDNDCTQIAGKGVCGAGTCVQCTAAEPTACGQADGTALVCDSLKRTCTNTKEHSAGLCNACVSDAECAAGQLCIKDTLGTGSSAKTVGYFCHWKQGDATDGAPADCTVGGQPYVHVSTGATSIDGTVADVCGLRVSSCPARNEFSSKDCAPTGTPDDALCGVSPPSDARCAVFGSTQHRCTMTCLSDDDCPVGATCLTGLPKPVCQL